jgi:hypothetical protein
MIEFRSYPKTPRLSRDMVITEKIDGTNSGIHVVLAAEVLPEVDRATAIFSSPDALVEYLRIHKPEFQYVTVDNVHYAVAAQSRNRLIFPGKTTDNYGFAGWVYDNAEMLARTLGPGLHFGEWWGQGIARRYDMDRKVFSLFNVNRWGDLEVDSPSPQLSVVPTLYEGPFSTETVDMVANLLQDKGSVASRGFMKPEGLIVFHKAAGQVFKKTLENDEEPKGKVR